MNSRPTGPAAFKGVFLIVWRAMGRAAKVQLLSTILLVLAASSLMALTPVLLKVAVDGFTERPPLAASPLLLVGIYVLCQWFARMATDLRGLIYARAERRMYRTLSEELFAHVMDLSLRFHLDRRTGAVNQTLTNGLQGYQSIMQHLLFTFLPVAIELAIIAAVFVGLDQGAFMILFVTALTCYATAFAIGAARISTPARAAALANIDATAVMTDGILNYEAVKYLNAEHRVRQNASDALSRAEAAWVEFYRRAAANGLVASAIFAAFLASTLLYTAYQVQRGTMTVGDFFLINAYTLQVLKPIEMAGIGVQHLTQGAVFLHKMLELFHQPRESSGADSVMLAPGGGEIEFRNVSVGYEPGRLVLKDVSFKVPAGSTLGIVGASGAGKSTLVRLIVRLIEPQSGLILIDGIANTRLDLSSLRRAVAVVPQDSILFDSSIAFNIGCSMPDSTQEQVERAAKLAHLHDFAGTLVQGYETRVGERGVRLSGGEKQRISIARAVLKSSRIFVFDEATSSLDSRTERDIVNSLKQVSQSSTCLAIAHRLSTVVHADEIIVLDAGRVAERGTHQSLMRLDGKYASLWRAQNGAAADEKVPALAALSDDGD